ncbi:hypothetical protein GALMADRAFT_71038 [Galerina marginata CBS 339.88]|uniref:Uncharacterized protein n=1 Tax=Galerina marginata (strain CBS 339.88) TaxID=685588 RepID=A0A067SUF7_GALM3|nr:hypothetical protein GALMADRAFT_71038 [Galerina marginata CBS 339.88]
MLGGSLERKEKARRLITQTVNSLTAKMEIGGPMAALYLLENPDHYTSHKFIPVYWKNYVRETYKPFEDKTLYEWVQMATRIKIPSLRKQNKAESEDELDLFNQESLDQIVKPTQSDKSRVIIEEEDTADELNIYSEHSDEKESGFDEEYSDEDNASDSEMSDLEKPDSKLHSFLKEHPLYKTYKVQFDDRKKDTIPNFVGGSLPRCDRGDREYYCATMLTLFKPWRSGKDLKNTDYSWDETFNLFEFTEQQKQYMKHFNVRYECNDARDDYSAQLKKGNANSHFSDPPNITY